jgi:hypothetical protein
MSTKGVRRFFTCVLDFKASRHDSLSKSSRPLSFAERRNEKRAICGNVPVKELHK